MGETKKQDPSLRKNIQVATLNKVKDFLNKQTKPVFKSEIKEHTMVDYKSVNLALTMIDHKVDKDGKIYIERKKK